MVLVSVCLPSFLVLSYVLSAGPVDPSVVQYLSPAPSCHFPTLWLWPGGARKQDVFRELLKVRVSE